MAKKSAKQGKKKGSTGRKPATKVRRSSRPKATRKASASKARPASRPRKKSGAGRKAVARRGAKAPARKPARTASRAPKASPKKGAGASGARKTAPRKPGRGVTSRDFRGRAGFELESPEVTRGLGPETGGQSGDTEGVSRSELADSESVEELLEEGQAFEAGIVSGVENAPDADKGGVRTRQFPEDDVPQEYLDED
jgi:hypothetical protein